LWLLQRAGVAAALGRGILRAAPWLMKALSVAGTAAMFLVGGGILVHGWPLLHHALQGVAQGAGGGWRSLVETVGNGVAGVVAGALVLLMLRLGQRVWRRVRAPAAAV